MFNKLNKIHQTPSSRAVKKLIPNFEFKKKVTTGFWA